MSSGFRSIRFAISGLDVSSGTGRSFVAAALAAPGEPLPPTTCAATGPPSGACHDRGVLFGGDADERTLGNTWEWDGTVWRKPAA